MEIRRSSQDFCSRCGTENETVGSRVELCRIGSLLRAGRQRERKRRALPYLALHPDSATMQLDALAGESQPQASTLHLLVRRPHLPKLLEDRLLVLRRDANPGVGNRDLSYAVVDRGADIDSAALRRELEGV